MGGSQVPPSTKPSEEGTTVCLSSDSVQLQGGGYFWYFGTIQTWDASIVVVDQGRYGKVKGDVATVRQYRSAKQCSSIQPGTESSLHSHPKKIPSSCSHKKRKPLPFLQPCVLSFVSCLQCQHTRNSTSAGGGAPSTAGCIPVPPGQACSAGGRERHVRGRCTVPTIRHVPRRQLVP
jgi:hypothetical protein